MKKTRFQDSPPGNRGTRAAGATHCARDGAEVPPASPSRRRDTERCFHLARQLFRSGSKPSAFTTRPAQGQHPEGTNTAVGNYVLREKIGEGGMGIVYLADQTAPVQRRVALKIIKPGMDSRELIARFEAERQALALMDHPNIAHVFDAGTTAAGHPYFVMEHVHGTPVTEYCDRNFLSTPERLKIFAAVCNAIQHAHDRGIVHRDLKPSNILITETTNGPVVKVIDFGVAKAIDKRLTDKTLYTSCGQMVGTPQYMAPEQADGTGIDADPRSDVYSLGALLYELLTGTTPILSRSWRKVGIDEIHRLVCDIDPPAPSRRLKSMGRRRRVIARRRYTSPRELKQALLGDLDWIVMKALEKDRRRRYESSSEMAVDIQRYLKHESVRARPPSIYYRTRKFTRRHKTGSIVLTLLSITLFSNAATAWFMSGDDESAKEDLEPEKDRIEIESAE